MFFFFLDFLTLTAFPFFDPRSWVALAVIPQDRGNAVLFIFERFFFLLDFGFFLKACLEFTGHWFLSFLPSVFSSFWVGV